MLLISSIIFSIANFSLFLKLITFAIDLQYSMLTNSRRVADKKEGVGTYCFILRLGLRITFSMDKATAHTKGYVETH